MYSGAHEYQPVDHGRQPKEGNLKQVIPVRYQDVYFKAVLFAARAHQGQTIPGSDLPYIIHPSLVCMELMAALEETHDQDLAVQCALLHDVIEDTGTTYEQVREEFGIGVADGVLALTKNTSIPKNQRMEDSLQRIRLQPREVWMVKLADRITNLQSPFPTYWTKERFVEYGSEALRIHSALKESNQILSGRLLAKIQNYEALTGHQF